MLPNKEFGNQLLDFYGSLLTEHQIEILKDYYEEDLSMIEIAENYSISKSAVSDLINRSMLQLLEYENKLELIDKNKILNKVIENIKKDNNEVTKKYLKDLEKLI